MGLLSDVANSQKKRRYPELENFDENEPESETNLFAKWVNEKLKGGKKRMVEVD